MLLFQAHPWNREAGMMALGLGENRTLGSGAGIGDSGVNVSGSVSKSGGTVIVAVVVVTCEKISTSCRRAARFLSLMGEIGTAADDGNGEL
jgi:hypothetical protein